MKVMIYVFEHRWKSLVHDTSVLVGPGPNIVLENSITVDAERATFADVMTLIISLLCTVNIWRLLQAIKTR